MEGIEPALREAIETGEAISIKYFGGSQPGSIRQISPISVSGDDVRARCLATNRVKTFKLSKIELQEDNSSKSYIPGAVKPEITSLKEGLEKFRSELESVGWVLNAEESEAGLYRMFKNGKLRKTPDVYLQYQEMTYDYTEFDDDGNEIEIMKPSTRPWYVRSNPEDSSSTFKSLGGAIDKFIEFAHLAERRLGLGS